MSPGSRALCGHNISFGNPLARAVTAPHGRGVLAVGERSLTSDEDPRALFAPAGRELPTASRQVPLRGRGHRGHWPGPVPTAEQRPQA